MNIGENYRLESDVLNITLSERHISKKGKVQWRNIGYFALPQNALKFLADHRLRESGFKDLQTITQRQQEIYDAIDSLLRGLPQLKTKPEKQPRDIVSPRLKNATSHVGRVKKKIARNSPRGKR